MHPFASNTNPVRIDRRTVSEGVIPARRVSTIVSLVRSTLLDANGELE